MKLADLDQLLADLLTQSGDPMISDVHMVALAHRPGYSTRLKVELSDGATAYVLVRQVTGANIPPHPNYELPAGV